MDCPNIHRLSRFYDGELSSVQADAMRDHIGECAQCAAVLADMQRMSQDFEHLRACEMSAVGMNRAHGVADKAADASDVLATSIRVARILTGLAASIMIIAAAWLLDDTERPSPAATGVQPVAIASDWERTAVTLDVPPAATDDRPVFADAAVADWMLRSLNR